MIACMTFVWKVKVQIHHSGADFMAGHGWIPKNEFKIPRAIC